MDKIGEGSPSSAGIDQTVAELLVEWRLQDLEKVQTAGPLLHAQQEPGRRSGRGVLSLLQYLLSNRRSLPR